MRTLDPVCLWMFGKQVEKSIGPYLLLPVYLICGIAGSFLHTLFSPGSTIPCVGASGAISGVAGFFLALFPMADFDLVFYFGWIRLGRVESHAKAAVGAWIGEQLLLGLLSQAVRFSATAFWAHVGGFRDRAAGRSYVQAVDPAKRRRFADP